LKRRSRCKDRPYVQINEGRGFKQNSECGRAPIIEHCNLRPQGKIDRGLLQPLLLLQAAKLSDPVNRRLMGSGLPNS
jgi:hypothetical protein